jgi:hypothetical protein
MKTCATDPLRPARGYVLITVLLLAGLIVATTAGYARHTTVDWRQSTASLWVHETREAAQSGVAFARQVLSSGQGLGTSSLTSGGRTITVSIADAGGDKRAIHVEAMTSGLGATIQADARVYGFTQDTLPTLGTAAVRAVQTDAAAVACSGTMTLADRVITGTLRLATGCNLTLRDVVLHGSIVSEAALRGPPYRDGDSTTLTMENGVRIEPTSVLPGCAILMPDGAIISVASSEVELHGAVVGRTLSLAGTGSADAQVVASQPFRLPSTIDRPGFGRAPQAWPAALQPSALGLRSLAFQTTATTAEELTAIRTYVFPRR